MRFVLLSLLVAVAYLAAAELGFTLALTTKQVTAVWPPTGIAVAALLLCGYRIWPGIWVGAFVSNAISSEPIWTAGAIATGNTLAPVLSTYLLRRFDFHNALDRVRDVVALAVLGSALAMTVSATNGVLNLIFSRIVPWHAFGSVWWVWWAGDAMGALVVAPLILTWAASFRRPDRSEGSMLELVLLATLLLLASWASFISDFPLRFSIYPFVIWTAMRFRQRETAAAIALICGIAIWATAHGFGPWTSGTLDSRLVQVDSWMSVFAITGLVLGGVASEKRAATSALEAHLEVAKEGSTALQSALLPRHLPDRPGLRCDSLYLPAEREAMIGGDWYDAFELPGGQVALSIGDVVGHGLDAAAVAVRLRQRIRAIAFDTDDPAEILTRVDRTTQSDPEAIATAAVGIIDRDFSTLSYATAGHPPPILASPERPATMLPFGGLPFGAGLPIGARTRSVALEPGSVLLFYTDGLTEFRRDIDRTETAVLQAVARVANDPQIEKPAAFVQRAVMGTDRADDDTVLLVAQLIANGVALRQAPAAAARESRSSPPPS